MSSDALIAPNGASQSNLPMTKPEPLPTPSTNDDLTNISSSAHLQIWDTYVCAVLQGLHSFHGAASAASAGQATKYAGVLADKMMAERQDRAQGHIDQGIVEKAKAKEEAAKPASKAHK